MKQDATAEPHTATERRRQLKKESTPVYAVSRNFTLFKAAVKDLDTLLHHLNQHIQCSNVFALIHAQCLSGFVTLNRLNMLVYACICLYLCGSRKHRMSKAIGNPQLPKLNRHSLYTVGRLLSLAVVACRHALDYIMYVCCVPNQRSAH